jgi:small subunit ribosomal protein S7
MMRTPKEPSYRLYSDTNFDKLVPDHRFGSKLVAKFINCMMEDGKKSVATRIFYDAMDMIQKKIPDIDPVEIFKRAVDNVQPSLEVRSRRVGGANYQVPMQVRSGRQRSLAIRWIIAAARNKSGRPMFQRLADELMAAARREGEAISKREQTIKMAEANKAFSHFAW